MRNSRLAALVSIPIVIIALAPGAAFLAFHIPGYDQAIRLDQQAGEAWANVHTRIQRTRRCRNPFLRTKMKIDA